LRVGHLYKQVLMYWQTLSNKRDSKKHASPHLLHMPVLRADALPACHPRSTRNGPHPAHVLFLIVTNQSVSFFLLPGFFAAGAFPCSFYQTQVE